MTKPAAPQRDELEILDDRIDLAYQFMLDARIAYTHNPNAFRKQDAEDAEAELNLWLDKRSRIMRERAAAEGMVTA